MKNFTIYAVLFTALIVFAFRQTTYGQLLVEEFDYTAGDLLTNHGWTAHSGSGTQPVTVNNGGLTFSGYASGGLGNSALLDNNGEDVHRIFTPQSSGTVYAAFLVKVNTFTTGYFLHLGGNPIGTTFRARVHNDATNHFGLSVGTETASFTTGTYSTGTTYLLVAKYEIVSGSANDKVSLFVFDSGIPSTEPSIPTIGPLTDASQSDITPASVALRQYLATENLILDGIRVTTSWSELVGSPVSAPAIQASDVVFSSVTGTGFTTSWTNGDGQKRIAIISQSSSIIPPLDGTDPTANPNYSGSGQQVVYNGGDNSVNITGLSPVTTYWVQVFEYNGSGVGTLYCTASGVNNPGSQSTPFVTTAPEVSAPTVSSITYESAILGGTIVSDGGSAILERGTVWSLNSPVTINDNKLADGNTSSGIFTQLRSGLSAGTEIFFAAYATNSVGTTLTPQTSFYTLAIEPSNQATNLSSPTVQYSTIAVSWSDNDGTQPATGFLIKGNTTGVFTAPVDGFPELDDTVLSDGVGAVNITAGTNVYVWNSLNPSTTYYFAIYPYTNSGSTIDYKTSTGVPVATGTTTGIPVYQYTWQGADNASWSVASNWSPNRTTPSFTDVLVFSDGTFKNVTGVTTETIGRLVVAGNTKVTLQSSATATLTLVGGTGADLDISSGSELNLTGANAITLAVTASATGSISGAMTFTGGAHRLISGSASGVVFNNGSQFKAGTGFSGNAFGVAIPYNAVSFEAGSTYIHQAGSNPFGATAPNSVVTFQQGSLFKAIASFTPSFSGRTYADFELDAPGATLSPTGTFAVSIQNLTITNGTLNFNLTSDPGHAIKGNIFVATGGILNFSPASAGTVSLNGIQTQTISGSGTITGNSNSTLLISNASSINLDASIRINGIFALNAGLIQLTGSGNLTLGPTATILGTPSASAMIVPTGTGEMRKEFPTTGGSFTFPVGDNTGTPDYSPVTLNFTAGTFATGNYAGITLANSPFPGDPMIGSYLNRHWNITSSGITSFVCDANFQYVSPTDITGTEGDITCFRMLPQPETMFDPANTTLHRLTASGLTSFGTFTGTQLERSLSIKLFLEGLYMTGGTMAKAQNGSGDQFPGNTADQVTIELHDATPGNYSTVIYSTGPVNLSTSGGITLEVPYIHSGEYYLTVRHRNSIETVSSGAVSFSGTAITYDFTDSSTKAFGSNMKQHSDGKWLIFTGDSNQDGIVDSSDMIEIDNDGSAFAGGYLSTDLNGDGLVDSSDLILADNNGSNFVSSVVP